MPVTILVALFISYIIPIKICYVFPRSQQNLKANEDGRVHQQIVSGRAEISDKSNPPKSIHICGGQFANRQLANWSNPVFYQGFIYHKASFYDKDIITLKLIPSSPKHCRIYLILLGEKPCKTDKSPLQFSDNFFDGFSSFRIRRNITVDISA